MAQKRIAGRYTVLALIITLLILALLAVLFRDEIWSRAEQIYAFLTDRDKTAAFVSAFGPGAPLVFMSIQVLQVILAPVPGEATGFIGGYLFGTFPGFLYSSLALSLGSWINFSIGRFLGYRYVRKLMPSKHLERFDRLVNREGAIIIFILFVFPGFPKDYLCLFLGLSAIPFKLFMLMATIGRMPGTFMLSIQGAMLFERNYAWFGIAAFLCILSALVCYRYRDELYKWIEKQNQKKDI